MSEENFRIVEYNEPTENWAFVDEEVESAEGVDGSGLREASDEVPAVSDAPNSCEAGTPPRERFRLDLPRCHSSSISVDGRGYRRCAPMVASFLRRHRK